MFLSPAWGTVFPSEMSANWTRPPGRSPRHISENTALLSAHKLMTPLLMTTSAHLSSTGKCSASPSRNSTFDKPSALAVDLDLASISSVMSTCRQPYELRQKNRNHLPIRHRRHALPSPKFGCTRDLPRRQRTPRPRPATMQQTRHRTRDALRGSGPCGNDICHADQSRLRDICFSR